MNFFEFVQKFFLILLPGVLGSYLYALLNVRKEQHYYFEFLKMVMLSCASYLCTDIVFWGIKKLIPCFVFNPIDIIHQIGTVDTGIPTENVLTATMFSLLLACALTKAESDRIWFRFANKLRLTRRIDNQPVWGHMFDECDVVVLRDQITKNIYYGKVCNYSDNSEHREICFENVAVYNECAEFLYRAEKLYISRMHNEFTIEVQDDENSREGEK